jgi:hypothetical protein
MRGKPMICDVPAHYLPKPFCDFVGDRFAPRNDRVSRHS